MIKEAFFSQKMDIKDELFSIVSHELKTPLMALRLRLEIAKRDMKTKEKTAFDAENICRVFEKSLNDIFRISRLVEDMSEISQLKKGKLPLFFEPFCLEIFFQDFQERMSNVYPDFYERVSFNVNCPELVRWDKLRMEQVILNLLNNAVKYGQNSPIQITAQSGGGYAYITVRDNGSGISKQDQQKIFQKFERGQAQTDASGMGLGLYLCKQIIKLHKGKIRVKSEKGVGTSFEMQIPMTF